MTPIYHDLIREQYKVMSEDLCGMTVEGAAGGNLTRPSEDCKLTKTKIRHMFCQGTYLDLTHEHTGRFLPHGQVSEQSEVEAGVVVINVCDDNADSGCGNLQIRTD